MIDHYSLFFLEVLGLVRFYVIESEAGLTKPVWV